MRHARCTSRVGNLLTCESKKGAINVEGAGPEPPPVHGLHKGELSEGAGEAAVWVGASLQDVHVDGADGVAIGICRLRCDVGNPADSTSLDYHLMGRL